MDMGPTPGSECRLCHFLALRPRSHHLTSLRLHLVIYSIGALIISEDGRDWRPVSLTHPWSSSSQNNPPPPRESPPSNSPDISAPLLDSPSPRPRRMAADSRAGSISKHTHHDGASCLARSGKREHCRGGRGKPSARGAYVTSQARRGALLESGLSMANHRATEWAIPE